MATSRFSSELGGLFTTAITSLDLSLLVGDLSPVKRTVESSQVINDNALAAVGLSKAMVAGGISTVHKILDGLDLTLTSNGEARLSQMVELANLSAIIGNLLRTGIAKASNGRFVANGPHRYPDLIASEPGTGDLEIKVALETNKPKGHLAKPGPHLTCRYVLAQASGAFTPGKASRGDVAWIWEVRAGILQESHFNISNTPGDSGKTAVINAEGFRHLHVVYCALPLCPAGPKTRAEYAALLRGDVNHEPLALKL